MRILHIIPTLGSGGAERMLSKLVNKDNENTHTIVTLLREKNHYKLIDTKLIELNNSNNIVNKAKFLFDLINIIKKEDVDLIQTWSKCNYYGPFLKYRFPNLKVISNFRNGYKLKNKTLRTMIFNKLLNKFDGHIFVSKSALQERIVKKLDFSNPVIITNGFEAPEKKDVDDQKATFVIGHIGRLHPVKNQKNIIKAFHIFSKDKNVELLLSGRNLLPEFLNIAECDNPKIKYLGEISKVENFYRQIDVLIVASKSEGFPNVIGEAMSHEKYVIATNAGESFEILGDTGYKLKTGNISEIIESFEYIYSNKEILHAEGIKSKERILERYDIDTIIEEYKKYYKILGVK